MAEKAWHVVGYLLGFLLFYEPFMIFQRITSSFLVETGFTSIHVPCARIPLANILTGQWQYSGPTSLLFCLLLIVVSLWFGPLFCGWLSTHPSSYRQHLAQFFHHCCSLD